MDIEIFNKDFIFPYWLNKKKHKNYHKAVDVAHHVQFHFDGYFKKPWILQQANTHNNSHNDVGQINPYFTRLIDARRPTESLLVYEYRRMNYLPITKVPLHKVFNSLKKIVKSSDWKIDYSHSDTPNSIPKELTLERYCEEIYPKDDSLENFTRKTLLRWMLVDPNAICVVMPLSFEQPENELPRPYAHIIQSKDVLDYEDEKWFMFISPYVSTYLGVGNKEKHGKIIMIVTDTDYIECKQTTDKDFDITIYPHNINSCPAWLLGGEEKTPDIKQPFYESYLQPMLPSLDAAAGDFSDLQAEKVQHMFSTQWYIQTQECSNCNGVGKSINSLGSQIICPTCSGGRGGAPPSPYRAWEINMNNTLSADKNIPFPPGGYITKPTEMVTLMRNEISQEIYDSLSAINFEFLGESPIAQSGISKAYDSDESNNFVYEIAYNLVVENLENIYYFTNEIRYQQLVPNEIERNKMLPSIPVPENYDFIIRKDAEDTLIKISGSQVSENIKELAEQQYIHAKFQDLTEERDILMAIYSHDPLPGTTREETIAIVTAGLATKQDGILHIHIKAFVNQIMETHEHFLKMDFDEQKELLNAMADNKANSLDSQYQIKEMSNEEENEKMPISDVPIRQKSKESDKVKKYKDPLENA